MKPGPAASRESTRWWAVAAAFAGGIAIALNVGKVPVALPGLRAELGLTLVQAGWVSSAITSLALVLAALLGAFVGRVGAWQMVMAGLMLCSAGSVLPLLLPASFAVLLTGRLVEGLGFMCVAVATPALVSAATQPKDRRFALSLWSAYMPMGAGLAMLLSPVLLPLSWPAFWPMPGWRALWVLAALGLCAAAAFLWVQRDAFGPAARPASNTEELPGRPADSALPPGFWLPVRAALAQPLPWVLALRSRPGRCSTLP